MEFFTARNKKIVGKGLQFAGILLLFPLAIKAQKLPGSIAKQTPPIAETHDGKTENTSMQGLKEKAFSYFPELETAKIKFKKKKLKTTMAARPSFLSLFKPKHKRTYYIFINDDSENPNALLLDQLPPNAQVGVIGHEYAHILDYQEKSGWQLMGYGIKYIVSKKFKRNLENNVDKITISKGLGWQVYNFSSYVFNDGTVTNEYREYKKKFYFTPAEILQHIVEEKEVYKNLSLFLNTAPYNTGF